MVLSELYLRALAAIRRASRLQIFGFVLAAYVFGAVAWMALASPDDPNRTLICDLIPLPAGIITGLLAWFASGAPALSPRGRRAWRILALAFVCFAAGDWLWFAYENILGETPFPSLADGPYLAYYPILLVGLLTFPIAFRNRNERNRFLLDAGTILVVGAMVVWYLVLQPTASASVGQDPLSAILSLAYPIGDLILLYGVTAVSLRRVDGHSRRALRVLIVGLLLGFGADVLFAYQQLQGTYSAGGLSDMGFTVSWLALAWAGITQAQDAGRTAAMSAPIPEEKASVSRVPYAAMIAGYVAVLGLGVGNVGLDTPLGGLLAGSVVLGGLVILRQVVAIRENLRLVQERTEQRSAQTLEALVQNSSDIITVITADTTFRYESPSAKRILGYERLIGTRLIDLAQPAEAAKILAFVSAAPAGGASGAVDWRLRRADGSWADIEAIVVNVTNDPQLQGLVVNMRDVTERKALETRLSHQAFHDSLTGLANRALLIDRVEHAVASIHRRHQPVALVFLDVDDLKRVNDSLGHAAGDRVLAEVARRIGRCLRRTDTAARFGGDEFAILLEGVRDIEHATATADRILDAIRVPISADGTEIRLGASAGLVLALNNQERTEDLLRNADLAMYVAKARGKDCVVAFEPAMHTAALERLEIEADLRGALERNELFLVYQPVVNLVDGSLSGMEALLRWRHPTRGIVQPAWFIPVAEETGLIRPIGRWVIRQACREFASNRAAFSPGTWPVLSVNVAPQQLDDLELVSTVRDALAANAIPPESLTLEITETALREPRRVVARLRELKALGVNLAVDDFGTGYSSLSYLSLFPIDILKIDRSFVAGIGTADGGLVRGIVELARSLNLSTVAEGIEQYGQWMAMRELGCTDGQGFLFAAGVPIEEVATAMSLGGIAPATTGVPVSRSDASAPGLLSADGHALNAA